MEEGRAKRGTRRREREGKKEGQRGEDGVAAKGRRRLAVGDRKGMAGEKKGGDDDRGMAEVIVGSEQRFATICNVAAVAQLNGTDLGGRYVAICICCTIFYRHLRTRAGDLMDTDLLLCALFRTIP